MIERWIFEADYSHEQAWRLIEWCRAAGADEFTVHTLEIDGQPPVVALRVDDLLAAFRLPDSEREQMSSWVDHPFVRPTPLWRLSEDSLNALHELLPAGPFTPPSYVDAGWSEDPIFYRDGEVLLGIISHEGEGILRVTPLEATELSAAGFLIHDRPDETWRPWNQPSRPAT